MPKMKKKNHKVLSKEEQPIGKTYLTLTINFEILMEEFF